MEPDSLFLWSQLAQPSIVATAFDRTPTSSRLVACTDMQETNCQTGRAKQMEKKWGGSTTNPICDDVKWIHQWKNCEMM